MDSLSLDIQTLKRFTEWRGRIQVVCMNCCWLHGVDENLCDDNLLFSHNVMERKGLACPVSCCRPVFITCFPSLICSMIHIEKCAHLTTPSTSSNLSLVSFGSLYLQSTGSLIILFAATPPNFSDWSLRISFA